MAAMGEAEVRSTTDRRSVLPPEVEEVFREFRTCEFSTVARDGTPIAWPLVTL